MGGGAEEVGIDLHPKVGQGVRRLVVVGDAFATGDAVLGLVQGHVDRVVDFLLPIFRARGTGCGALVVGGGQDLVQLAEAIEGAIVQGACREKANRDERAGNNQR